MLEISEINQKNFSISTGEHSGKPKIIFTGKIDISNPEVVITPFLSKIDSEIIADSIKEIYFDVRNLDFINSSGIKVILQYVMNIIHYPRNKQYNIIIIYDKNNITQKTRFSPISFLAPDIIKFLPL